MNRSIHKTGLLQSVVILALFTVLGTAACSTAPKTTRQYFYATYEAITTAYEGVTILAQRNVITPDEGLDHVTTLDRARGLVDAGASILTCRSALKGKDEAAIDKRCGTSKQASTYVYAATAILNQVQQVIFRNKK